MNRIQEIRTQLALYETQNIDGRPASIVNYERFDRSITQENMADAVRLLPTYLNSIITENAFLNQKINELRSIIPANAEEQAAKTNLFQALIARNAIFIGYMRAMKERSERALDPDSPTNIKLEKITSVRDTYEIGSEEYQHWDQKLQLVQNFRDAFTDIVLTENDEADQ